MGQKNHSTLGMYDLETSPNKKPELDLPRSQKCARWERI
jgi:hypothetical protein